MFFILSKVLLIFIQPMFWVFVLLICGIAAKNSKRKKRLIFSSLIVLYIFSNSFLINQFAGAWDITTQSTRKTPYSCAIVLGGFTSIDANGNGFFNGASSRYIAALKLKTTGQADRILVSGGSGLLLKGHDFKEADYVADQLRIMHLPDSTVLKEGNSRNTKENAVYSKKILDDYHVKGPYLLITSAFHMRRALYTFKKAGLDVVPYSSDYGGRRGGFSILSLLPDADTLAEWNLYTKELVGYLAYHLKAF